LDGLGNFGDFEDAVWMFGAIDEIVTCGEGLDVEVRNYLLFFKCCVDLLFSGMLCDFD
jgi:hypothetical protein